MSESNSDDSLEEVYSDEPMYTVTVNGEEYELNEEFRRSIQRRAEFEYAENESFSCWWKVASPPDTDQPGVTKADVQDWDENIHSAGDPVLVIETAGRMVPWDRLDQLELEEQTTDSFNEFDDSGSDVSQNSDNGMRTVKRDGASDDGPDKEKERAHFGVTPKDFEEAPSPDGEDEDRIPAKPEEFDEPEMVFFVPENPDVEHTWSTGEAITAMHNWVEWNVQVKADQPMMTKEKDDSHDIWESMAQSHDCETLGTVEKQTGLNDEDFEPVDKMDGTRGGNNWDI